MTEAVSTILFGAFDRHNFGDLLFPHINAALLGADRLQYAGLAERDLRPHGGHQVAALARLAAEWGDRPVNIVHAGGELLTCDAWQAAVMLQTPEGAQAAIARYDRDAQARQAWARQELGLSSLAPYTMSGSAFREARSVLYNGVGGVGLAGRDPAFRAEVLAKLGSADFVGVRDHVTFETLTRAGIAAHLMPDPAVMVAELFGARIRGRRETGEVARVLRQFPQAYLALQFSADFGDDATLGRIAAAVDRIAGETGLGSVFFRAGAAPWHDDLEPYRRVMARMRSPTALFESLDLWDICALIAHSRGYCGSSLHGRIVAMAFALPRVNLLHPGQTDQAGKLAAYAATWESHEVPHTTEVDGIAQAMERALLVPERLLQDTAARLSANYRVQFSALASA